MTPNNRVLSGIQPTGHVHLGNYLGAILNWVKLQETHECLYCIVDMHAITVWQEPKNLEDSVRQTAAVCMACGVDVKKHILFNQSQVSAHAELAWILNCTARLGWLNRMTQFKEKAGKDKENASIGLFAYPVLMAADILAYRATHVPVGDDQKQHLELARDIAQKFNNDYAASISELGLAPEFFPLPEPLITGPAPRVMSLRDGTKKMSKSDLSDYSRINLTDDADVFGATPLMLAAGMGSSLNASRRGIAVIDFGKVEPESRVLEAVTAAVALGADVNAANQAGDTALHSAASQDMTPSSSFLPGMARR